MQGKTTTIEGLNEQEQTDLLTGGDYIIFNNLHGGINVWINCDEDMQVTITHDDFIKLLPNLFPKQNLSEILKLVNRGEYVYTDRTTIKPLRAKVDFNTQSVVPTLDAALSLNKASKPILTTPFGISF